MCAFQRVNNSYSRQNSKVLNGFLKPEMAFEGFVMSDWHEQKSGIDSALAGLDVAMPISPLWSDGGLVKMVKNGSDPESRIDDIAMRVLAAAWKFADLSPGAGGPCTLRALASVEHEVDKVQLVAGQWSRTARKPKVILETSMSTLFIVWTEAHHRKLV
ncbi:hypothetical protein LIA77_11703 [Sarocladium implicatum]|nr:hypothetical protein LIA77_11703 [Sarocladium implicatum]